MIYEWRGKGPYLVSLVVRELAVDQREVGSVIPDAASGLHGPSAREYTAVELESSSRNTDRSSPVLDDTAIILPGAALAHVFSQRGTPHAVGDHGDGGDTLT